MRIHPILAVAAIAAFAAGTAAGCSITGNGPWLNRADLTGATTTEVRDVDGFTEISMGGDADLTVIRGEHVSVEVTADSGIQDHIETAVEDSTIRIRQAYSIVGSSPAVKVAITVPNLTSLSLSGSADATVSGIQGDSFDVNTSGSSDVHLDGDVGNLTVSVSGSGDLTVTGTADSLDASVSGAGTLSGSDLAAAAANVSVSGSGDVTLHVRDALDARVSGAGDLTYLGDPTVTVETTGAGEIHHSER